MFSFLGLKRSVSGVTEGEFHRDSHLLGAWGGRDSRLLMSAFRISEALRFAVGGARCLELRRTQIGCLGAKEKQARAADWHDQEVAGALRVHARVSGDAPLDVNSETSGFMPLNTRVLDASGFKRLEGPVD